MGKRDTAFVATLQCPFPGMSPTCPISRQAEAFDPFEGPYQIDPAEALRWSRDREPVFFSPKLGYWVVSRYEHVKSVFRDNLTFSPAIALEKINPITPRAVEILQSYEYGMGRTLVNEDEPAHMDRRRALMHSFAPDEIAKQEPMVRRLTRSYVDRFVDRGETDLVGEMLWEIPLIVALHFLGVPEEHIETIRRFSIAHTINIWGRPTPEQEEEVAEAVGKFWQFAGQVVETMREDPSGPGWVKYAMRQQRLLPEVVTDSYIHSMMMAGIVAAHETTAYASANAMLLLLQHRDSWNDICADPSLIPNAVEECLRHAGSVVAWRRIATVDTRIGDVDIPAGAKLLLVSASANHDGRHFDHADTLDIYRDNTTDHLTFGYGSHQCLGKNLARMEMRIFLEEFTRRLPHMRLVPGQPLTYVPNTSFRGPRHLLVRWEPEQNPERRDPSLLDRPASFPVGAPENAGLARPVRIVSIDREAEDVIRIVFRDPHGRDLPAWSPGAHVELLIGDYVRKYSISGDAGDPSHRQIAILREAGGRGGSAHIHDNLCPGDLIRMRGPKNHFLLNETADRYLLIAGGIGITPIIAMADRLKALGKSYELHYAGRSSARMAFLDRLRRDHVGHIHIYAKDEGGRLDLEQALAATPDAEIYACGPERMLDDLVGLACERQAQLHIEHFSPASARLHPENEKAFDAELCDSGITIHVAADQTLLQALGAAGVDVASDCEEGLCGSCEVRLLAGDVDHRDRVLTAAERAAGQRMMACCSRARGGKISLAL